MSDFRNKIFLTLFLILSLCVLGFVVLFNIQNYLQYKNDIQSNLNREVSRHDEKPFSDFDSGFDKQNFSNVKFMDEIVYTVLLDDNNNIKGVINHSNYDITDNKIKDIAAKILNNKGVKDIYVGFLYTADYSYAYNSGNSLVLVDNEKTKRHLLNFLFLSIFIFVFLLIVIYFIAKGITNKITKPVNDAFERQKQFVADASHELKTPLSVIIASAEAFESNPKEIKWLNNVKMEADRMSLLITNLLDLASLEGATCELKFKNLSKVITLSILTFEGKAYENGIKLDYDIEDNIMFNINEDSIKQLVEILLDNAIKYSLKNKVINVSLKKINNNIILSVSNEGVAIKKSEEEKIFERFYRADISRNRKDNRYGLGLAIAKNIVLNHGGVISASSNNGLTTFKVVFKK